MNKKILLIEDNPHILEAVKLVLTTESYNVHAISYINDIVKEVTKVNPFLILLDLLLSGKNGTELVSTLKQNTTTASIPIVIVSAHPSAKKTAKSVGADDFLAKPFDIEDLLLLVKKYLKTN